MYKEYNDTWYLQLVHEIILELLLGQHLQTTIDVIIIRYGLQQQIDKGTIEHLQQRAPLEAHRTTGDVDRALIRHLVYCASHSCV